MPPPTAALAEFFPARPVFSLEIAHEIATALVDSLSVALKVARDLKGFAANKTRIVSRCRVRCTVVVGEFALLL